MPALFKLFITLVLAFASTFLIIKMLGGFTLADIESYFQYAQQISPLYLMLIIIGLLFLDLFIAVPTLTITLLAGFLLGHSLAFIACSIGVLLAGFSGYGLSYLYGDKLFAKLVSNQNERHQAIQQFKQHGLVMILLSRALPILPETSTCLAGISRMPLKYFSFAWLVSSLPYLFIATYAGSTSTLDNPKPAIYAALCLTCFFWLAWFAFNQIKQRGRVAMKQG